MLLCKQKSSLIPNVLLLLPVITLLLAGTRIVLTSGNVINDMDNMLRDVTTEMEESSLSKNSHIDNHAEDKLFKNPDSASNEDDNEEKYQKSDPEQGTSVELLRFVSDDDEQDNSYNSDYEEVINGREVKNIIENSKKVATAASDANSLNNSKTISLEQEVRLLSKQLNALMNRRREDYELLEHNLRKSLQLTTNAEHVDLDLRTELEKLR